MIGRIINNRYAIVRILHESAMSIVYLGEDRAVAPAVIVVLKVLKREYFSEHFEDVIRYKNEVLLAGNLRHPNIVSVKEIIEAPDGFIIVMEYVHGDGLQTVISPPDIADEHGTPDPVPFPLAIAIIIQLCHVLEYVHERGIVHRDLKPSNIIIVGLDKNRLDPPREELTVKILDFGLAKIKDYSHFEDISDNAAAADRDPLQTESIAGTINYMAPEQFNLGSGTIDERSDLYSVGIILYQLVTGVLPFQGDDIASVIHQQLAKAPEPPTTIKHNLPVVIDDIIRKLLEKDPAKRYQSARGLIHDLMMVQQGNSNFVPGRNDRTLRLHPLTGLIGRDRELDELKKVMTGALQGNGCLCLLNGEAGIGKTRLIDAFKQYVANETPVDCIYGTCIDTENKMPYWPIASALAVYIRKYKKKPLESRAAISARLKSGLGDLGEVILQLNPDMREVLGECPPLVEISPDRSIKRFIITAASFFADLSLAESGLVIVFEDMHWADDASIALVEELLAEIKKIPLLLVCTYRDAETASKNGIRRLIRIAVEKKYPIHRINLKPLDDSGMENFIAEVLQRKKDDDLRSLTEFINVKSHRNPLFALQIIKMIIEDRVLQFDGENKLLVDAERLQQISIPGSIVELLLQRTGVLDDDEQRLLSFASVIGKKFELSMLFDLTAVFAFDNEYTLTSVDAIVSKGMSLHLLHEDTGEKGLMAFSHDLIRDAFYSRLADAERKSLHNRICEILETKQADPVRENSLDATALFDLASHAIAGGNRERALRYCYPAGIRAMEKHAYADAINYFSWALVFSETADHELREDYWLSINTFIGEIYLITGNHKGAIALFTNLLPFVSDPIAQASMYKQICQVYSKTGDWQNCERNARIGLGLLGENLIVTRFQTQVAILKELLVHLAFILFPRLFTLSKPANSKEKYKLIYWFYYALTWSYLLNDTRKFARTTLRMLHITQRHLGKTKELGSSLAMYGLLCMTVSLYKRSVKFQERALSLRTELADDWGMGQSYQLLGYCYYFKTELDPVMQYFDKSIALFNRVGDLKEIGLVLSVKIQYYIVTADYLNEKKAIEEYLAISKRIDDVFGICISIYYTGELYLETGDYAMASEYLEQARSLSQEHEIWLVYCLSHIQLGVLSLEGGDAAAAITYFETARRIKREKNLLDEFVVFMYFYLLEAYIKQYSALRGNDKKKHREYLRKIRRLRIVTLRKTRSLVVHYSHALLRAHAMYYAMIQKPAKAEKFFLKCIEINKKYGIKRELGRSLYEYGLFLLSNQRNTEGHAMAIEAYQIFYEIGDIAHMQRVRSLLGMPKVHGRESIKTVIEKITDNQKAASLAAVIRLVSSDLSLSEIAKKILSMAASITRAARGYILMLDEKDMFRILAKVNINNPVSDEISWTIVGRTIKRGDPVFVVDAASEKELSLAESVMVHQLKSIISVPIKLQNTAIGAFYLDNALSSDIFTDDHVEFVTLLAEQLSVAIEISNLRKNVDRLIDVEPSSDFCIRYGITKREKEIILLLIKGYNSKEIGDELSISHQTVKSYMKEIYYKTGVNRKLELVNLIKRDLV